MTKVLIALLAAASLSGCISFGGKAPPSLLNLTSDAVLSANDTRTARAGEAIIIAVPTTPQAIATSRVAVSAGATEIAYIKDGVWVEPPAKLFQRMLAETVAVRTGRVVLEPRHLLGAPSLFLSGNLSRFGIDADSNEAVVTYDALLSRGRDMPVTTRRFEARAGIGAVTPVEAGRALNKAANKIAGDVAEWVGK
jgi:cholesterol transport system auxiliary component